MTDTLRFEIRPAGCGLAMLARSWEVAELANTNKGRPAYSVVVHSYFFKPSLQIMRGDGGHTIASAVFPFSSSFDLTILTETDTPIHAHVTKDGLFARSYSLELRGRRLQFRRGASTARKGTMGSFEVVDVSDEEKVLGSFLSSQPRSLQEFGQIEVNAHDEFGSETVDWIVICVLAMLEKQNLMG